MYRNIIEQLKEWKNKEGRKPLILSGARQVGKTYILKRFGEQEFANVAYINCDDNELAKNLFMQDYNIQRIILAIGAITEQSIEAGKTLIILDEIQESPRGLSVLKYFCENAPNIMWRLQGRYWVLLCIEVNRSLLGRSIFCISTP